MKEFVAETGGRYTYADDILNLQELALSMSSIFSGCSDFIISGCENSGNSLTAGYVWINGKIRYFEGCSAVSFPFYIYETNSTDTVAYANEVNKKGRNNYLCSGSNTLPEVTDVVTGTMPHFIELGQDYAPRFIDRFFGKYTVLLETPFARQTIRKDLVITGNLSVQKTLESKTAVSILNPQTGHSLKSIVKETGNASLGVYHNGLLVNEVILLTDGSFRLMKQEQELARFDEKGITVPQSLSTITKAGAVYISGHSIINYDDATDEGAININSSGYNNGKTKFRNLHVYDGRQTGAPILQVTGKSRKVNVNGTLSLNSENNQLTLGSSAYLKDNPLLRTYISWVDSAEAKIAEAGFISTKDNDFTIKNAVGNISLTPVAYVNIEGDLKIAGVSLTQIYVSAKDFSTALQKKVDAISGKRLSTEDFTTLLKNKLEAISSGNIESGSDGFVTSSDVIESLRKKLSISSNLNDLGNKADARIIWTCIQKQNPIINSCKYQENYSNWYLSPLMK